MNRELIETVESLGGTALMGGILIQFSDTAFEQALKKIYEAGVEAEREAISDEWWSCYQADLENGVKSLNEYEAMKFANTYPELAKFGKWIDARGQA